MSTLSILIIRHAEKPNESWPGPGLTPDGTEEKKSLVIRGWQRTGAWSALFGTGLAGDDYPQPAVIYAANPKGITGDEPSRRRFETISPLAARLMLAPVVAYSLGQETKLVADLLTQTGVVLVCWEHKAIAAGILPALAGAQRPPGLPKKWDGTRFDVVLRFDRSAAGDAWSFRQLFPQLLSGDIDSPMP